MRDSLSIEAVYSKRRMVYTLLSVSMFLTTEIEEGAASFCRIVQRITSAKCSPKRLVEWFRSRATKRRFVSFHGDTAAINFHRRENSAVCEKLDKPIHVGTRTWSHRKSIKSLRLFVWARVRAPTRETLLDWHETLARDRCWSLDVSYNESKLSNV